MTSPEAQIQFAIEHKRLLRLTYFGKARVVEPHDYGRLNGEAKLLVYQRYEVDDSRHPRTEGWRILELSKFESCEVLDETVHQSSAQPIRCKALP